MIDLPERLMCVTLDLDGPRHLRLRVPATSDVIPLAIPPDLRGPALVERRLCLELEALIDTIDAAWPTPAQVAAIVRSPARLAAVLQVRNALYDHLALQGRAQALCPRCDGRAELDLTFYWLALRLPPWAFADQGVALHVPSLSARLPTGMRPDGWDCARRIVAAYPDAAPTDLASLQSATAARAERAAWDAAVPEDEGEQPEERAHWRRDGVGFAAMLRLSVALAVDPAVVDAMPVGQFLFLDLLHFATNNVDVRDPQRLAVACPQCGAAFLPVLPAPL